MGNTKIYLALAALFCAIMMTEAIVCTKDYCDRVRCAYPTDCPAGSIVEENASVCGCCPLCIKMIPQGDRCPARFAGSPATEKCANGLGCSRVNGESVCN